MAGFVPYFGLLMDENRKADWVVELKTTKMPDAKTYVIDDAELQRVKDNYPVIWKDPEAKPKLCFLGCPHMSLQQIISWTEKLEKGLKEAGNKKVQIPTVFTTSPAVKKAFDKTEYAGKLRKMGVIVSYICPLMYMDNPLCSPMPVYDRLGDEFLDAEKTVQR